MDFLSTNEFGEFVFGFGTQTVFGGDFRSIYTQQTNAGGAGGHLYFQRIAVDDFSDLIADLFWNWGWGGEGFWGIKDRQNPGNYYCQKVLEPSGHIIYISSTQEGLVEVRYFKYAIFPTFS